MSIDSLSPREIKALKLSLLSEHFQFSPETFAAEGQDVVNTSIYLATESLEGILMERIQAKEGLRFEDEEMIEAVFCFSYKTL